MAVGCGGAPPALPDVPFSGKPRPARGAALCGPLHARVTGHLTSKATNELSGLVLSRAQRGVLWTHNDSGDRARLFAVAADGRLLAEVAVAGAKAIDWEDIAIGPRNTLYIGDIGDNDEDRPEIAVYRLAEPRVSGAAHLTARAQRLALRYPDGAHNAEALLVDPSNGALVIVTKALDGDAGVYVAAHPSPAAVTTLRRAGHVSLGFGRAVTAGDVSANGRTVVLRTYDRAFVWSRRRTETIPKLLRLRPCRAGAGLIGERQGEAIALTPGGRAFFTVAEGKDPPLRRYSAG